MKMNKKLKVSLPSLIYFIQRYHKYVNKNMNKKLALVNVGKNSLWLFETTVS